ncbi:MAG: hypothetical protein WAW23_02505 [Candidatus Methanoperedens sp.]
MGFVNGLAAEARQTTFVFFIMECNDRLKSAQQKVEQLIKENGELRTEAFEPEGMHGEK